MTEKQAAAAEAKTHWGVWTVFFVLAAAMVSGFVSAPIALAAGIAFALVLPHPMPHASHVWAKKLLQASVVALGFGMNLSAVWAAGRTGFAFTVATIFGTLFVGLGLGRMLKVHGETSLLVSAGTAICGGSAIAAVGSVIDADKKHMSVALCTVFILNAVALFVFPVIGHALDMNQQQFGLWAAIAIHDTSSVVGAAAKYGNAALDMATTVKLARALWIFPIALGLALMRHKGNAGKVKFPWFIVLFVCAAGVRTLLPAGAGAFDVLQHGGKIMLVLTLFLIGSGLSRDAVRTVGVKPLILGVLLWAVVSMAGLLAVRELM